MFEIVFYRDRRGKSDIVDFLDELQSRGETCKSDRVNRNRILVYIQALKENGTRIGEPFIKHIEGDLWELRPIRTRIFFFYWGQNTFVLLHHFMKKSQKTPQKEIEQAKRKRDDHLHREGYK